MKPIVAVVGRPNVGKSTFFNRVTKSRDALVDDMPGVTRDRLYRDARWNDTEFTLVDTGGFLENDDDPFAGHIREQIRQAVADADAVILMLDGKTGLSPYDRDMVHLLRDLPKPIFHVVNKIDGEHQEIHLNEFCRLGIEQPIPISAEHGYGIPDFLDALVEKLPPYEPEPVESGVIRVAVVGRPNAGKSSLVNRLLGQERLVVSDVPGTTRDAVDTSVSVDGRNYVLVDTAGIRRKGRVREKIEKFSIIKALKGMDRCDVALIVLDAGEGVTEQDITVAGYAHERGCGCVMVFNKWDLVEKDTATVRDHLDRLKEATKFLSFAPVMTVSALTGLRVSRIFRTINAVYDQYATRVNTGEWNRILERATTANEPPMHMGHRLKFYYATQVAEKPPTVVCFVNHPEAVHFSYQRYLLNQFREHTGLDKTPIKLLLRQRTGHIDFGGKRGEKRRQDGEARKANQRSARKSNRYSRYSK